MADTFLDNQTVTAEDLNSIAIDLGVADYSHFPETPPQSAVSALNQITSDIVGKGVLLALNNCNVTVSQGVATVNTGIIVFETGAKKRITTAQSLNLISGVDNYIYALNDIANNTIKLVTSSALPTTGDLVSIAKVSASGNVTPMRDWSKANVDLPTKQKYYKNGITIPVSNTYTAKINLPIDIDVGFSNFSSAFIVSKRGGISEELETMIWDFKEGEAVELKSGQIVVGTVTRDNSILHFKKHEDYEGNMIQLKAILVF